MELPLVSFGIPTYDEEKEIERCLASIFSQDYPKDKIEVIVIDDGSTDRTLEICRRFPVRIIQQRRDTPEADPEAGIQVVKGAVGGPEAGRKLGVIESKGEFVVLLSADNELAPRDWLSKMVKPIMEDPELAAVRPPVYAPRNDPPINRYLALMETKTPLEFYLFRMRRPKTVIPRDGYFIDVVDKDYYPPLVGGNGSLLRRDIVIQVGNVPAAGGDIDLMCRLVGSGYVKFGFVPDAVVYHHYARNYWDFIRRLHSKVDWFLKYSREYQWLPPRRGQFLSTVIVVLFCATFVGPLLHGFRMRRRGDPAWLYHPLACSMAVVIYGTAFITSKKGIRLIFSMLKTAVRN